MSKKETEFDRYDRMKKLEKEAEVQKRRSADTSEDDEGKKSVRQRAGEPSGERKKRVKAYSRAEEEYDYV